MECIRWPGMAVSYICNALCEAATSTYTKVCQVAADIFEYIVSWVEYLCEGHFLYPSPPFTSLPHVEDPILRDDSPIKHAVYVRGEPFEITTFIRATLEQPTPRHYVHRSTFTNKELQEFLRHLPITPQQFSSLWQQAPLDDTEELIEKVRRKDLFLKIIENGGNPRVTYIFQKAFF